MIGEVAKNGRARKLPIKADIRKALCFPGGSTLMSSHLLKDSSSESAELPNLSFLPTKSIQLYLGNQEPMHVAEGHGPNENNQIVESGYFEYNILGTEMFPVYGKYINSSFDVRAYQLINRYISIHLFILIF